MWHKLTMYHMHHICGTQCTRPQDGLKLMKNRLKSINYIDFSSKKLIPPQSLILVRSGLLPLLSPHKGPPVNNSLLTGGRSKNTGGPRDLKFHHKFSHTRVK